MELKVEMEMGLELMEVLDERKKTLRTSDECIVMCLQVVLSTCYKKVPFLHCARQNDLLI